MTPQQIAEAFSGHSFSSTFDHLAPDVRWVLPGAPSIEGRNAVIEACEASARDIDGLSDSTFIRFVSVADYRMAAVDAVGRYVGPDGRVSVVSSADIYEFDAKGRLATITSYAVELAQQDLGGSPVD